MLGILRLKPDGRDDLHKVMDYCEQKKYPALLTVDGCVDIDYEAIKVDKSDLVQNLKAIARFELKNSSSAPAERRLSSRNDALAFAEGLDFLRELLSIGNP